MITGQLNYVPGQYWEMVKEEAPSWVYTGLLGGEALSSSYSLTSVRADWKMSVFCSHSIDHHKSQGQADYQGSVSYTTFLESCIKSLSHNVSYTVFSFGSKL